MPASFAAAPVRRRRDQTHRRHQARNVTAELVGTTLYLHALRVKGTNLIPRAPSDA